MAKIFTAAIAQGMLRSIHTEVFAEGVRDKMFDTETIAALGCALRHKDSKVRSSAVEFFAAALDQGALHCFLRDIHTKIFAGSLWEKIFVIGTVTTLGHALGDKDLNVRTSMVEFFTSAIAQGAFHFFCRVSPLKCLQRVFGTRYLSLRPSPH